MMLPGSGQILKQRNIKNNMHKDRFIAAIF